MKDHDEPHWDLDERINRDSHREPSRRRRIRPQLTGRGSLRVQFEREPSNENWLAILRREGLI